MGVPVKRGPAIGTHQDQPIYSWLEYPGPGNSVLWYTFAGVGARASDGGYPLKQLKDDEILVFPGLIYAEWQGRG
jgi:hypothetical protein